MSFVVLLLSAVHTRVCVCLFVCGCAECLLVSTAPLLSGRSISIQFEFPVCHRIIFRRTAQSQKHHRVFYIFPCVGVCLFVFFIRKRHD